VRRGRTAREIPPPLELQCLTALWALGEANVQAVRDHLAPKKSLAYTTVMTMLDRLTRKQVLTRRKVGRSFLYQPLVSREEIRRLAVRELVDSLFDGEDAQLRAYVNGTEPAEAGAQRAGGAQTEESQTLDAALL
jgi:predicted transcriptional regulator